MRIERGRLLVAATALALAALILLFPPWTARAIRTTTRYSAVPNLAPATLVDTVTWTIRSLGIFAPPRAPLAPVAARELARLAETGDEAAKQRLLQAFEPFERRIGVPEILRTSGDLWRDSLLAAAGMPSVSFYEIAFSLDDAGIALRLTVVLLIAFAVDRRRALVRSSRDDGGEDHTPTLQGL